MKKNSIQSVAVLLLLIFSELQSFSQTSVASTTGYSVNLNVYPVAVVPASTTCTWGYNYTIRMNYNITFTGSNVPSNMYTLQGTVGCGSDSHWFDLPTNGGTGSSYTSNAWSSATDCNTVSVASQSCNTVNIHISGLGISDRVVSYSTIGTTLGIKLMSFSANLDNNKVKIRWTTASETNNDYFSIERSTDNIEWKEIKRVKGAGNSQNVLTYEALDETPVAGTSYYRLKQTDTDGKFSYSNTQAVKYSITAKGISIYPVPNAGNTVNINGIGNYNNHELALINASGRMIYSVALNKSSVELPSLQPGMYVVRITDKATGIAENLRYVKM